jgi:hypothetical protein
MPKGFPRWIRSCPSEEEEQRIKSWRRLYNELRMLAEQEASPCGLSKTKQQANGSR